MNSKQRENTAKYLYDISKVVFTLSVVANAVAKEFSSMIFWLGLFVAALLFSFAYILDGGGQS